ncbi:MAG TPA: MFS transporter [Streptosporangiaceae bacterium]|nr:MFS transporter [Streptosporangiaceae bacterium]
MEDITATPVRKASAGVKIIALATGFVMASLDITVVNVAGATIQERLHTSLTQLTWIVDGYVLAFASLLLLGGGLANRRGAKVVYMWGMAIFVAASLACALSPNGVALVAARFVQGAGAALFMPSSLSLLVFAFPGRRERTRMLGLWSATVAVSAGLGPTLGGLTVSSFGWQSIFLLNLPVGVIGMALTARYIGAAAAGGRPTKLALTGHVIWITALAALSFVLIEGPRMGWSAGPVLVAYGTVTLASLLLIGRERRTGNPVMPWTLFRSRGFAGANAVGFLFNFAIFGCMFMLGLYLQNARGASPVRAGLELLPMTSFFPIANVVYSRISGRFANGPLLTTFLLVAAVASVSMVTVSASTPYWMLAVAVGIANIGAGIIAPGMTAALVDAAGPENANIAGSVLNTNRQIGSLVGIAALGAVLHFAPNWNEGAARGFGLIGLAYFAAALCAWRCIIGSERNEAAARST